MLNNTKTNKEIFMTEMRTGEILDPMMATVTLNGQIKGEHDTLGVEQLERQAELARQSLVAVGANVRGTCVDERPRIGTRGEAGKIEARPSVPGGPDVYALYVAELSGYFGDISNDPKYNLAQVKRDINNKGIRSGGHDHCAANDSFGPIIEIIAENTDYVKTYAKANMGETFNDDLADEVIRYSQSVHSSGRYEEHHEGTLGEVLEDEAMDAIELLFGEHEGRSLARQKVRGYTVDQTKLHDLSEKENGKAEDSFVIDDWYADDIENALASGPNAVRQKHLMEHAREFLLAAVAAAVPNKELHQFSITA